jgi:dihydroorotate dehydrogenase (fumarate)
MKGAFMADLSTKYMGLELENPLMVASCNLSKDADGIKRLADNGAGAVVVKSLFEEQVQKEVVEDLEQHIGPTWHAEAYDYVNKMGMEFGPDVKLKIIEEAKEAVDIPIIASLNCVTPHWWKDYAKQLESAGADGIELNISYLASDVKKKGSDVESLYFKILDKVKGTVNIPVSIKLGPFFTSFAQFAYDLCSRGASALVLFNRFYQFDIDVEKARIKAGNPLSDPSEMSLPLRWVALLANRVNGDIAASTGIHTAEQVIKHVYAGANAVQLCSVLYENGVEQLGKIRKDIENWMEAHSVDSLENIRGKLSLEESDKPELYSRLQYIKALVGIE